MEGCCGRLTHDDPSASVEERLRSLSLTGPSPRTMARLYTPPLSRSTCFRRALNIFCGSLIPAMNQACYVQVHPARVGNGQAQLKCTRLQTHLGEWVCRDAYHTLCLPQARSGTRNFRSIKRFLNHNLAHCQHSWVAQKTKGRCTSTCRGLLAVLFMD